MNGIEMAKKIKQISPTTPIIFATAYDDKKYLEEAIKLKATSFIKKPINLETLIYELEKFAKEKIKKDEENEFFNLLKEIYNTQKNPIAIFEKNRLKFANKQFNEEFCNFTTLEMFLNNLTENNLFKHKKTIYKVNIQQIDNHTLLTFNDVTKIKEESLIDELTSLFNRKVVDFYFNTKLQNRKLSVILMDIDNFKKVNDTYGHSVGDIVLKDIAKILKENVRNNDLVIRWGGEEFLIVIEDTLEAAKQIAEKLRKEIENHNFEIVGKITGSFGVCNEYIPIMDKFLKLVDEANKAMYQSKQKGKNQVNSC